MKTILTTLMLASSLFAYSEGVDKQDILHDYNYVIGTQTVGAKYKFTKKTNLVETACEIANMGSNLLKMSMSPRYWWENYDIPHDKKITSLELLAQEKSMKEVLSMKEFKYYQIWAYEFSQYTQEPEGQKIDKYQIKFIDGLDDNEAEMVYKEIYNLAKHLLTTYSGTGKVFYLGNWEGDWHLRWDYDRKKDVNPTAIEGMTRWVNVRQKAVDDAKHKVKHHDVELYYYIEVNLSDIAIKGKDCVINSILPNINTDFVSFSSYTATNPPKNEKAMDKMLTEHLNYIESKIKPKEGIEGKRLFIGEYGWNTANYSLEEINQRAKWVMKTALRWGCPFILFWEMYNNELMEDGKNRGYWLIDENGNKTPLYYTHKKFYKEGKKFVSDFYDKNHRTPSTEEFTKAAANFECLK